MTRLVVVGGGNMGAALVGGLLDAGWAAPGELAVAEVLGPRRAELRERFPGVSIVAEATGPAEGVVVAVKPGDVETAAAAVTATGARRVLSIAAGITTARLEAAMGADVRVVRAMPNTPALVRQGAAAIAVGSAPPMRTWIGPNRFSSRSARSPRVPESLLDAVTGLSGSGPAYIFLLAEALIDGGVAAGLSRAVASQLVTQLLVGSAALLAESGSPPSELRAQVTSPAGTTAAGLAVLERAGLRSAVIDCVLAATERSQQLGS